MYFETLMVSKFGLETNYREVFCQLGHLLTSQCELKFSVVIGNQPGICKHLSLPSTQQGKCPSHVMFT